MPKDLSINEVRFKSMVLIKCWSDTSDNIEPIITSYLELSSLTKVGEVHIQKNTYIATLSPGHYMIFSDRQNLFSELSKIIVPENAVITDVSHSRRGIRLIGKNAPIILNKEIAIDLSNETTPESTVLQTSIHSIGVILVKHTSEDFLILSYSSFFKSLSSWLIDSTKEYGCYDLK